MKWLKVFPVYQNKHWSIRWQDDHTVAPSSHHIVLKIVEFYKLTLAKKSRPYMTLPTFRGNWSKIEVKLLMHISKKSEPRGRDFSKNQEKMMMSNMDDQNLSERASNKLDCLL